MSCQPRQVHSAIEQLEEERIAESERTMSEAEQPSLYEPDGYRSRPTRPAHTMLYTICAEYLV